MDVETRSRGELIAKLQQVTLRGSSTQPYLGARIDVVTLMPEELNPCQRYVLMPELKKIEDLRWSILKESGHIDIFGLDGYIKCHYEDQTIDIIPPVCEEFFTADYKLKIKVNDGMHRVYLAYQMGVPITVTYVRGISPYYPYYSHIIPGGWPAVEIIDSLGEKYIKKFHVAKEYKKLFRQFNSQFENIGDSRVVNV